MNSATRTGPIAEPAGPGAPGLPGGERGSRGFLGHLRPRHVPESLGGFRHTFCLGGMAALSFLAVVVSGLALIFHYDPARPHASLVEITSVAPYGSFWRALHFWAGNGMVVAVAAHTARVILKRAYRPPREANWLVGVGLGLLTVLADFTGYLLLGDTRSLEARSVGLGLGGQMGAVGAAAARLLLGPGTSGPGTLLAPYLWHILLLPGLLAAFMGWHFHRVRRDNRRSGL
ncbi:cytochrome b N-terminal domain-containing protein [Limnochorda pilosa]|uniref:Cytochrome B6 n=1 Tax=Limnochorda pilosa TaxID=1555112 RepID=A0A0K2SK39_LIMPI|nr:cytochrome b N-terminal domain-containing protein [Limnochorda pilosa]BAS27194.1 cytochrome B6 [Limnochorda pilosa]